MSLDSIYYYDGKLYKLETVHEPQWPYNANKDKRVFRIIRFKDNRIIYEESFKNDRR